MYVNIHFDNREAPEFFNSVYTGSKKLLGIRWGNFLVQFPSRRSAIKAATDYKHYVWDRGYKNITITDWKHSVYAGIGNNSIKKEADLETARQWVDFYWQVPSE